MRILLSLLLLLAAPVLSQDAPATDYISPEIASFEGGVLCPPEPIASREAPGTVAGETYIVDEAPPFVSTNRIVPAVIGVGFGVVASVQGELGLDGVLIHVTHPPLIGSGVTEQSFYSHIGPTGDPGITFYQFDYGYEVVTGDWTIEARFEDYVLYRSTFTVVPPDMVPELADICGYTYLLG